jgi:hypothetical protein
MTLVELMNSYSKIYGEVKTARDVAKRFIRMRLVDGPVDSTKISEAAAIKGISRDTLRRAKIELGICARKDGALNEKGKRAWRWHSRPTTAEKKRMTDQNKATVTTIPAAPGWYVSALYDGADYLTDDPIVAWEITRYDARPVSGTTGRLEPIRRYLLPISTNGDLDANAAPQIVGWLLRDPTGRYHQWGGCGPKFDTPEEALAYLARQCSNQAAKTSKVRSEGKCAPSAIFSLPPMSRFYEHY